MQHERYLHDAVRNGDSGAIRRSSKPSNGYSSLKCAS